MISSIIRTFVATLVYKVYTSVKRISSAEFGIPDAHMWAVAARLIYQKGLPPHVFGFAITAFVIGGTINVLRTLGSNRWWRDIVPSGLAMGIGKYFFDILGLKTDRRIVQLN